MNIVQEDNPDLSLSVQTIHFTRHLKYLAGRILKHADRSDYV